MKRALLVPLLLLAAACGSEPEATSKIPESEPFNDADVAFATDMVPHHAQALSMVDLTVGRDLSPDVAAVAEQVRAAQAPEIEQLVDLLEAWEQPIPETSRDHVNAGHGDHGKHADAGPLPEHEEMRGMASADELAALESARGKDFEQMWLELMAAHHDGAVEMAQEELDSGEDPAALALAESIIEAQEAELEQIEAMLG
ncbi:DUF305 domain-containing protein [Nocardioides gansuensis]|uniref:DUF305 domain-containing protein n=1 Tax=Nocardioides gansuensis TaxID=2138300 RepID=A0A2T8FFW9_9ACTN|nr:DUF305 domain-containing protein [Nocardioides gansuensis]PVG84590.1 DUF305 domain-containing protein [Nocardioides gansuensis]